MENFSIFKDWTIKLTYFALGSAFFRALVIALTTPCCNDFYLKLELNYKKQKMSNSIEKLKVECREAIAAQLLGLQCYQLLNPFFWPN